MRQVGILAAACLYALDHNVSRLAQDHEHAQMLAEAIRSTQKLTVTSSKIETNMVIFRVDPSQGTAAQYVSHLASQGIGALPFGPQLVRLVTHLDVGREKIEAACKVLRATS